MILLKTLLIVVEVLCCLLLVGLILLQRSKSEGLGLAFGAGAGEALFGALNDFVADALQSRPISLSYEIQEIDPETRWKHSNIREYMQKRQH